VRAVLFDIDGTLLDSNDAHAHAWLDALHGHGRSVPFEVVRSKIGMGGDKLLRALAGVDAESVEGRSISQRRIAIFKAYYLPDLGPLPGARVLVDRVRSRGLTCVAVTSSRRDELADLLREAAVADLMDAAVTADDVDASKPDRTSSSSRSSASRSNRRRSCSSATRRSTSRRAHARACP
jgi:beta-phosphoglucomutase-like phosphatase (HAD superfamily)